MRKYENFCVGCPSNMGCLGSACPYMDVPVDYCDCCGADNAIYRIDNEDYCEECAKEFLQNAFDEMTVKEKADCLDIVLTEIDE